MVKFVAANIIIRASVFANYYIGCPQQAQIIDKKRRSEHLRGYGAYLAGGRWTLQGDYALYTAVHRSLAYLEYLVHQIDRDTWPVDVRIVSIDIDKLEGIITPEISSLPKNWNKLTYHVDVQLVGSRTLKEGFLGITVPSGNRPGRRKPHTESSPSRF